MVNEYVEERHSPIHGYGLFAKKKIPKGIKVIQYVGQLLTKDEAEEVEDDRYLFELNDTYDINGLVDWNPARYINHSCDPNCEVEIIDDKIWIISLREIEPEEELSYNYGYNLEEYKDYPCKCGSANCIGYILDKDHWHVVQGNKSAEWHLKAGDEWQGIEVTAVRSFESTADKEQVRVITLVDGSEWLLDSKGMRRVGKL